MPLFRLFPSPGWKRSLFYTAGCLDMHRLCLEGGMGSDKGLPLRRGLGGKGRVGGKEPRFLFCISFYYLNFLTTCICNL